jgi:tetratricopeptide (TPR) repeat protein
MRTAWLLLCLVPGLAAADRYVPGSLEDPYLGSARFMADDERYYSALAELLAIPGLLQSGADTSAQRLLLAESYLRYGLPAEAEALLPALQDADPQGRARLQLALAAQAYERGDLPAAAARLDTLQASLPKPLQPRALDLRSRIHLVQGQYEEAIALLRTLVRNDEQNAYARFNLGVALISSGRARDGREWLDRLGQIRSISLEEAALRDKANLALGWHYLNEDLGSQAREAFERIRVDGPFSNRALLGLGWAELASQRAPQNPLQPGTGPASSLSNLGALLKPGFFEREQQRRRPRSGDLPGGRSPERCRRHSRPPSTARSTPGRYSSSAIRWTPPYRRPRWPWPMRWTSSAVASRPAAITSAPSRSWNATATAWMPPWPPSAAGGCWKPSSGAAPTARPAAPGRCASCPTRRRPITCRA